MIVPVAMLFFALEFAGRKHVLTPRTKLLIWTIPIIILALVWTNEFHYLMWDMESISFADGLNLLEIRFGAFFWVHVTFSYLLLVIASIIL
ncbi:MAG: PAS domain-containing sensor histidine kinase, partial [Anaerolineales bacterium]|nr:PAS domain-containing sensor histidine kinase [Anaerolineales bacterium]